MSKVIDTNILLQYPEIILEQECIIPTIVIQELENIKTSNSKTEELRYKARHAVHVLDENADKYTVCIVDNIIYEIVKEHNLQPTNDNLIIACCCKIEPSPIFITNDLCAKLIAKEIFNITAESYKANKSQDEYTGYKEITLVDREMALFYENLKTNTYECLENQYLIIKNADGETQDVRRWTTAEGYVAVFNKIVKSNFMKAKIKAKDDYQLMAIDSIYNNTMTIISGKAGSGKSLLALSTAMSLVETDKYKRIVILFNPTKAKGATDLGFYSGSAIEKAIQNSIGEILRTKFNDMGTVDILIKQEKLKLLSMADCRGTEIKDDEILYITECQNTNIELLKLCLSRCSQNAKIIIEGDYNTQVDNFSFEHENNGMRRAIEVLKGEDVFGYVDLKNVWRSKIASLVDKM